MTRFKGSTIFVTGGAGFIGSAVVRASPARYRSPCRQHRQTNIRRQLGFTARISRKRALTMPSSSSASVMALGWRKLFRKVATNLTR